MLARIENLKSLMRRSERKVAEYVLLQPQKVINQPISVVAAQAQVSEPTVIRFCRALGCEGYQDFKKLLRQALAGGVPYVHAEVCSTDTSADLVKRIFERASAALLQARTRLHPEAVEEAVALLQNARQIQCYGHGASGVVALDAQQKLLRMGIPVSATTDAHVHSIAASFLTSKDVVIAISHTGRSQDILESVKLALDNDAKVIALTPRHSALGKLCTVCLDSGVEEDTDTYIPMISRLTDLTIIDVLVVALALRGGESFRHAMEKSKRAIKVKH